MSYLLYPTWTKKLYKHHKKIYAIINVRKDEFGRLLVHKCANRIEILQVLLCIPISHSVGNTAKT